MRMRRFKEEENGVVAVLVALMMVVFLGLTALVIDAGNLYLQKKELQDASDASALAGAVSMSDGYLEVDRSVKALASKNEVSPVDITTKVYNDLSVVEVKMKRNVPFYFASIFGYKSKTIYASSKVKKESIKSVGNMTNVIPLGVYYNKKFVFGQRVTLKGESSTDDMELNTLILSGSGASAFEHDLANGYQGTLSIGDELSYRSGIMTGPTQSGISKRMNNCSYYKTPTYLDYPKGCERLVITPMYEYTSYGNKAVIVGFSSFFIEGIGSTSEGSPIFGRFLGSTLFSEGAIDKSFNQKLKLIR